MTQKPIVFRHFTGWSLARYLILFLLSLFCLNVVVLSVVGSYDVRFGFVHFMAHGLFKPILMMNSCFILALMICGASAHRRSDTRPGLVEERLRSPAVYHALLITFIASLVVTVYRSSVTINFSHYDWTHKHISAGIHSLGSFLRLFTTPQADGFYRPLTFVSLWLDYRLFGAWYAGYHMQSIALHIVNSLLAAWLATTLGFGRACSLWTGLLYAVAAVNFEAVLWPAARFDLLATMFVLLSLIFAVRHFRDTRTWTWALPISLLCYTAGIMNKESGYCFPLLLLFIIYTHWLWSIPRPDKAKVGYCFSLVAAVTVVMMLVRIGVYGNLGGYTVPAGVESAHFKVGLRTLTSLLRAVPIPILGVNTTSAAPGWVPAVLVMFPVLILVSAVASRGCFGRKEYALLTCTLLASIPVLNIVGWIGTSMQHSRYLYLPAAFVMLLLASTLEKARWPALLLGAFLVANAACAMSNLWIYREMLAKTESLSESVLLDWLQQPGAREICLVGLPENPCGVFFFASELVEQIGKRVPNAAIFRQGTRDSTEPEASARLTYQWSDSDLTLHRVE